MDGDADTGGWEGGGEAQIQNDPDILGTHLEMNQMKDIKGKYKILHLGWQNDIQNTGEFWWGCKTSKKDLKVIGDCKL